MKSQWQVIKSRSTIGTTNENPAPAFNTIIDKNWGLSGAFLGVTFGLGGSSEVNVTAAPLIDATVQSADFVDDLGQREQACHITGQAYIITEATSYLVNSKFFDKKNANGDLIYIKVSGATYSETGSDSFYVVSVLALPIGNVAGKPTPLVTVSQIAGAGAHVVGLPSAAEATKLGASRDAFLNLSKFSKTRASAFQPQAYMAMTSGHL